MHLGKKHDYLGVDMEFCDDGALEVSMIKYLKNVIEEFPEVIKGRAATPAHEKLFVIRDEKDAKLLDEERALAFHHMVAQLLFMATRARRDIQTAVAFLTTRGKNPDEDDWGKLKRVLKYLNGTKLLVPSRRYPKYLTRLSLLLLSSHAFTMTGSGVLEVMSIQTLRVK